jgi:hypothetical protein
LSSLDREPEASEDVASSNNDKRVIVRRRTQQLVYLELGRDNGGVMLNLSEDGCGFQAITPVKTGETRFGFQISGGRRIAGEAEVVWVDDVGIMGGFALFEFAARSAKTDSPNGWKKQTRRKSNGAFEPAAQAPHEGARRGSREYVETAEAADPARPRDYRQGATYGAAGSRGVEQEVAPPPPAWANVRAASTPVVQGDQFSGADFFTMMDLTPRRDPDRSRCGAESAALAVATAIAALVVAYQRDVGTVVDLAGRDTHPERPSLSRIAGRLNLLRKVEPSGFWRQILRRRRILVAIATAQIARGPRPGTSDDYYQSSSTRGGAADVTQPRRLEASVGTTERQQSMLERQGTQLPKEDPEVWNANQSVESLWGGGAGRFGSGGAIAGREIRPGRRCGEELRSGEGSAQSRRQPRKP